MERSVVDEVVLREGYVLVLNASVPTVDFAKQVLAQIDRLLVEHGLTAVIFDTRETEAPPREVGKELWAWVERAENYKRAAIVAKSEMTRVSANMTALSKRAKVKSFADFDDAVAWVTR